ncbi:MAG: M28 family peptidase [Marinilabiliaceae bacterium]|nr:M28 family peptidase [Marinilabiliaceae bacterium]
MRLIITLLINIFILYIYASEPQIPSNALKSIKIRNLKQHMSVLTSDSLEGRLTGEQGCEKAADYIENYFKSAGLEPGFKGEYRQPFIIWKKKWTDVNITLNDSVLTSPNNFVFNCNVGQNEEIEKEIIFLGSLTDSSQIKYDVQNKIVFVCFENLNRTTLINKRLKEAGAWAVFGTNINDSTQYQSVAQKHFSFQDVSTVTYQKPKITNSGKRFFIFPASAIKKFFNYDFKSLSSSVNSNNNPVIQKIKIKFKCDTIPITVYNIVGKIKGSDSNSKALAITAHYDHVGIQPDGKICRGADDNASGTGALLELSNAFKKIKHPPVNNILFIAFAGEEYGLWGSNRYSDAMDPLTFLANINMDMIGRRDTITKDNYIYLLGAKKSTWLDSLSIIANKKTVNLNFDYHYDGSSFMNRSDHYHFYKNNIPVLSFFSGLHGDYHTPRDTMDKIDFKLYKKRIQLIFASAYLISYKGIDYYKKQ